MSINPWVLGIASSHNGGACLLRGNEVVVGVQEERLLRVKRAKHPGGFGSLAIQYCLDYARIAPADLDAIVLCASSPAFRPREDIRLNPQLQEIRQGVKLYTIPHHLGHAIGVYNMAGCPNDAAVMIIDGRGSPWDELTEEEKSAIRTGELSRETGVGREVPREIISTYRFHEGSYIPLEKHVSSYELNRIKRPGLDDFTSLGDMYGAVGEQIFGSHMDGPGKVMGLAPFGSPRYTIHEFYELSENSFIFGDGLKSIFKHDDRWPEHREQYTDLAASVQVALEEAVLLIAKRLRAAAGCDQLCYAGGVALNSVANERVIRESGFSEVFVMPAAEDSGTAIGAAFYGLWQLTSCSHRRPVQRTDNFGRTYTDEDVHATLQVFPEISAHKSEDIIRDACEHLLQGKFVGWHQGGSELGPRALGQRSILCDPRSTGAKEFLNKKVKFREEFRPFAPMILEEDVRQWFDIGDFPSSSPFMLRVMQFRSNKAREVPAVVHVDGTGRLQTVSKSSSPMLHCLLSRWKVITGVPILLNTSFNIAGEPIVETPRDALMCLCATGLDSCIIGQIIAVKDGLAPMNDDLIVRQNVVWFEFVNGSESQPALQPIVPADFPETPFSIHRSRKSELPTDISHLRVAVGTQWGEVIHAVAPKYIKILQSIDGSKSIRALFAEVHGESQPPALRAHDRDHFVAELLTLRRLGIVDIAKSPYDRSGQL
jgi:carbamoyltransferase